MCASAVKIAAAARAYRTSDLRNDEHRRLGDLMRRYRDRPMAFADACLVCMTELIPDSWVWTVDRDFELSRKHGRRSISLVAPW